MSSVQKYKFYLIFFIGLFISIALYLLSINFEKKRVSLLFQKDANDRIEVIQNNFITSELIIESTKNLFLSSNKITREEFRVFNKNFISKMNGILSIGWVPKVLHKDLNFYIFEANNDGINNFEIKIADINRKFVPSKNNDVYYPIYFIEPFEKNKHILGFDNLSEQERSNTLKKAIATKSPAISKNIGLVQGTDYSGMILFSPVFNQNTQEIRGFVSGAFSINSLVENALSSLQKLGIDIKLEDSDDNNQTLHYHYTRANKTKDLNYQTLHNISYQRNFTFGGKNILIKCFPTEYYFDLHQTFIPEFILIITLLITISFSFYYTRNVKQKAKINRLIFERTEELRKTEQRLSMAIYGANIGIWDWNVQTGEVYFNDRWVNMLEFEQGELEPNVESWGKLLHPDDKERVNKTLTEHLLGETEIYRTEQRLMTKSGKYKWILDIGKVVERDHNSKALRATGIHLDISELKETQNQLIEKNKELELHVKNKNRLFSIVGHDLRSPLASILGFSEFLRSDIDDLDKEEIVEYAGYIYAASNNINNLLLNLLEWGKFQMGRIQFLPEEYNLSLQLDEVANRYLLMASHKKIKFRKEFNKNLVVIADQNMIDTVIRNIITNAIKFSPRESTIKVTSLIEEDYCIVNISDEGIGMAEETINDLFADEFVRSSPGTEGEGGTGLGLHMCKDFIEQNNGELKIKSEIEKGTTISFSLPRPS